MRALTCWQSSSWLWHCWCMMPWVDCQVVMLDLCELWRLGVEYMPQLQMYEECGCCKFKSYTCNILQPARWAAQWALWEVRLIYMGRGWGFPGRRRNLQSLSDDICIFCRSCIQMGGWGDVNVRCIASSEDVVTLKIVRSCIQMGGWGMLTFIALRHQKITLKMLLRWRCCYVEFPKKTRNSQWEKQTIYDISWWTWKRQNNIETADNISQICCPHAELIPDILTL